MDYSRNRNWLAMVPRILGGLFVFTLGFIFLRVGLGLAMGLISEPNAIKAIIVIISLYTSVRLMVYSWRLILNRPSRVKVFYILWSYGPGVSYSCRC